MDALDLFGTTVDRQETPSICDACEFDSGATLAPSAYANVSDESMNVGRHNDNPSHSIDDLNHSESSGESMTVRTPSAITANLTGMPHNSSDSEKNNDTAIGSLCVGLDDQSSLEDSFSNSNRNEHELHKIDAYSSTFPSDENFSAPIGDQHAPSRALDAQSPHEEPQKQSSDLVDSIKGLYRILDLISERGSGGNVDKIIIDQESTGRFINELRPGAYKGLTKVDFKALDEVLVKPLGIYGSKSEIVRLLREMQVLDDHTASMLTMPQSEDAPTDYPMLRAGLYALLTEATLETERRLFVIFWPEETTWDDNAISTVQRNRTTFMRYLTKVTDQIMVLISEEHGRSLTWKDPNNVQANDDMIFSNDFGEDSDRLFDFNVLKAVEQEENVTFDGGMKMKSPIIKDAFVSDASVTSYLSEDQLKTRFVAGDTRQALLTAEFRPGREVTRPLRETYNNALHLKTAMLREDVVLLLSKNIPRDAISLLVEHGLADRYPEAVSSFKRLEKDNGDQIEKKRRSRTDEITKDVKANEAKLTSALESHFVKRVLKAYPRLDEAMLRGKVPDGSAILPSEDMKKADEDFLRELFLLYPELERKLGQIVPDDKLIAIKPEAQKLVQTMREIIVCNDLFWNCELSDEDRRTISDLIDSSKDDFNLKAVENYLKESNSGLWASFVSKISLPKGLASKVFSSLKDGRVKAAWTAACSLKATEFLPRFDEILDDWSVLQPGILRVFSLAGDYFAKNISRALYSAVHKLVHEQIEYCKRELKRELDAKRNEAQARARSQLIKDIEAARPDEANKMQTVILDNVELRGWRWTSEYHVSGTIVNRSESSIRYTTHPLELTEADRQAISMDSAFIPKPKVMERGACGFSLPLGVEIRLMRLLPNDLCLVAVEGRNGDILVYLGKLHALETAIAGGHPKKIIKRERTGRDVVLSYDEERRTLAVCGVDPDKPLVQVYRLVFDESYGVLGTQGGIDNLTPWYTTGIPKIVDIHIIGSTDELALLEDTGRLRIFSRMTRQFRPATLELRSPLLTSFATPDGSCLGAVYFGEDGPTLSVYHWSSFGFHEGFSFQITTPFSSTPVVSAFHERRNVHLFMVDSETSSYWSVRINITRPVTEIQLREESNESHSRSSEQFSTHNSLLDCHSDVWSRFPVLPAIQRHVKNSGDLRKTRSICFVTAAEIGVSFRDYFDDMIQKFEGNTKKPTGSLLSEVVVHTSDFHSAASRLTSSKAHDDCSVYKAGEWVVDIFCLIPIQIAITRDNRFVPLKDGVWAPEAEKSLLGADVGCVADSISFGWYESIFESYMSTKPVKIVSSMGEQSVGKSFALNHLADTSFAGSAMRTTEGVWMAVTPTETDVIVALDFEGVHSIERSAQEDTLLVLFNAAISNLVLFRNNYALSRDITNLFQSFQSSSSILDPDANPMLFQSRLVIIIKDVVDSDSREIKKEFQLKLQRIVQEEQFSNFISRLYGGRLSIIPWPVIESRQFYTLFSSLKGHLDRQASTNECGAPFLRKLKMLMAKLKTNDWGSMSQSMATHRAQQLLSLLPRALSLGAMEVEPDTEPLKNFDTNHAIDGEDTNSIFWFGNSDDHCLDKRTVLHRLISGWDEFNTRQQGSDDEWRKKLSSHLQALADRRVAHVQAWVDSNLSQFTSSNAAINELRRALDASVVELKKSVELCKARCDRCHLLCVNPQFHEDIHDCSTNHICPHSCSFADQHDGPPDVCSLGAGHEGIHICDPSVHLCGHACDLSDRKGCQGNCTKIANHGDDSHACSSRHHFCGKPCELQNAKTPNGKPYTCQGTCCALWDEEHERHVCEAASCPIACQLCNRLCSMPEHLHGLEEGSTHLCGQEHTCKELCSSDGVCEIETAPEKIETTFSGAHDQFQYTKYTQVTNRLQCAIPIPPGLPVHEGPHVHTTSQEPFHYCDARCGNCGYVCTLPYRHRQPEHSTNHGSMTQTRWVIDGPNGNAIELAGHKFGTNDDGAPMLCNLVCSSMGRHVHVDHCRAANFNACNEPEAKHISVRMEPDPERPKDWISHKLYWGRLGFKDPYSREEQSDFAKCDAMCSGQEHEAKNGDPAQPSYCTLPIFHQPAVLSQAQNGGYVSDDGHLFTCKNPAVLTQAFHVIFVIDRSSSMSHRDRRPLDNTPVASLIARFANNRLGAVYSALHSFWTARVAAMNHASTQTRRDAYSVVLFDGSPSEIVSNDFERTPDELLGVVLRYSSGGGTNFSAALSLAEEVMTRHWSTERTPVVIFLSDGECSVADNVVYSLCNKAVSLGRALSFQSVSFGSDRYSTWLRRMVQIAKEVQNSAPRDPFLPTNAQVDSKYSVALDSVTLTEAFLGIANSLRKTRGGLIHEGYSN